jgi:hypothetical protein
MYLQFVLNGSFVVQNFASICIAPESGATLDPAILRQVNDSCEDGSLVKVSDCGVFAFSCKIPREISDKPLSKEDYDDAAIGHAGRAFAAMNASLIEKKVEPLYVKVQQPSVNPLATYAVGSMDRPR